MPKQLEIIVQARDQASGVLKNVGESAGGLGSKLSGLNELAEAGHGLHSVLRQARNISIAFEILPVGVDAVKAAFSTMTGSAEDAAKGQRALYEGIKGIPLVGKPAGEAAEWLGAKLAHAFGKQSTAEMEADIKAKEDILKEFTETEKKLAADLGKMDNEAALVNLTPSEAQIEKAKQKYKEQIDGLKAYEASLIKAGGQGKDVSQAIDQVHRVKADALVLEQNEIAKAHNSELAEQTAFNEKVKELAAHGAEQIQTLTNEGNIQTLDSENRGYEARFASLQNHLSEQVDAIRAGGEKSIAEYQKQIDALMPLAQNGDKAAIGKISQLAYAQMAAGDSASQQEHLAKENNAKEQSAARDEEIRKARIAGLQQEAAAGDEVAKLQLQRLDHSREQEATENGLRAILADEKATDQQKADASAQLGEIKKAELATTQAILDTNNLSILKQEAEAGNEAAKAKLDQLEFAKQQQGAEAQLQSVLSNSLATDQQKIEAQRQLNELKGIQAQQANQLAATDVQSAGLFLLQQEATQGDKLAEQQLKKIELEKEYTDQKKKLLDVLNNEKASEQAKADARKVMAALDDSEANAEQKLTEPKQKEKEDNKPALATLDDSRFLTGVQAAAEQDRDQYAPVVNAQNATTAATLQIVDVLHSYLGKATENRKVLR